MAVPNECARICKKSMHIHVSCTSMLSRLYRYSCVSIGHPWIIHRYAWISDKFEPMTPISVFCIAPGRTSRTTLREQSCCRAKRLLCVFASCVFSVAQNCAHPLFLQWIRAWMLIQISKHRSPAQPPAQPPTGPHNPPAQPPRTTPRTTWSEAIL